MSKEKILSRSSVVNKTFSYKKGNVSIDLTFRVDIKQELKDGIECVERFIEDAKEELKNIE